MMMEGDSSSVITLNPQCCRIVGHLRDYACRVYKGCFSAGVLSGRGVMFDAAGGGGGVYYGGAFRGGLPHGEGCVKCDV